MLRIPCPWCGVRDESEFRYRGDATRSRPGDWHTEWWLHVAGCRRLLKVVRHTLTHEIRSVEAAGAAGAERAR